VKELKRVVLILGAVLLVCGTAMAAIDTWQIKCGVDDNAYPYGNDSATRFGVAPGGTWDYDGNDAAHPPIADPTHDLGFVYDKLYYRIYQDQGYGWPPPWGRHGTGSSPSYPSPGLLKDTREPIPLDGYGQPEFWQVKVYAPCGPNNPDVDDATMSFVWEVNTDPAFEVPAGIYAKIWGNADLETAGVVGDLDLLGSGDGVHMVQGIVQWGLNEDEEPIKNLWVIEAGSAIPEPGTIVLMAGGLVGMAGLIRRKK
jgi:hypothetical protein